MHSWKGGGVISTMMTTVTTTTKTTTTTTVNKDKDEDNSKDNGDLIFDTTTNLWSDAFLAGRGSDFVNDDDGNNDGRGEG